MTRAVTTTTKTRTTRSIRHSSSRQRDLIAIAMSGGVDSSVVAYLLTQQYSLDQLVGIHMSNWNYHDDDQNTGKCWEQDWKDTKAVARHLQLSQLHHVSFQQEYWNDVFEPYTNQIAKSHITPNPDVNCNRYIKFGVLKEYLKQTYGISRLATGHYARLWDRSDTEEPMPEYLVRALNAEAGSSSHSWIDYIMHPSVRHLPLLMAAKDRSKDQSYFLCGVPAMALSKVLFPLGDYYKNTPITQQETNGTTMTSMSVRQLAQHAQLPNAHKRDSMGICFIGKRKHGEFLNEYIAQNHNHNGTSIIFQCINIENQTVVATVDVQQQPSLWYATPGQGAKLAGASQKWFVVDKDITTVDQQHQQLPPTLMVCPGTHHPSLYADTLYIQKDDFHWILGGIQPPLPFQAKCRIRHLQPLIDCVMELVVVEEDETIADGQSDTGNTTARRERYKFHLGKPLRGIAPGQVCAVYVGGKDGDLICLGGGPIQQRGPSYWDKQKELPSILHPAGHNDSIIMSSLSQS